MPREHLNIAEDQIKIVMSIVAAKSKPMANQKASTASSPEEKKPSSRAAATPVRDKAAEKMAEARKKNLDLAISSIQKEFGETAIMRMGDEHCMDVDVIPTGNLLIDRALGVGGLPRGRIVEIYGPESSGKTTLTLTAIAQAQRRGGLAAFIDVEHALDPQYARKLGVNLDDLLVSQPSSGEEALQLAMHGQRTRTQPRKGAWT